MLDRVDEYVTEMVLAKLEERDAVAAADEWDGQEELDRVDAEIARLRGEWQGDRITDDLFFGMIRELESQQAELRNARGRHTAAVQRASVDVTDVRRRRASPLEDGGLDISQKRAVIREWLDTVIVLPVGRGNGSRATFDPNKLVPIWRRD